MGAAGCQRDVRCLLDVRCFVVKKPIRSKPLCIRMRKIGMVIIFGWLNIKVQQARLKNKLRLRGSLERVINLAITS